MKIVVIGANNSGKGTLVKQLNDATGLEIIGCSRELEKNGLDICTGKLLPDFDVNEVMKQKLIGKNDFILEGYPRTVSQNDFMINELFEPDLIIFLNISEQEVLRRAVGRRICPKCNKIYNLNGFKLPQKEGICDFCNTGLVQREDDKEKAVKERYYEYLDMTEPIINIYKYGKHKAIVWEFDVPEDFNNIASVVAEYIKYVMS